MSSANVKRARKAAVSLVDPNAFEYQFRHPVLTQGRWRAMSIARLKKQPWYEKFLDFLQDTQVISTVAPLIGTAAGVPQAGQTVGDIAGSIGFGHVIVKRPMPAARPRKPRASSVKRKK